MPHLILLHPLTTLCSSTCRGTFAATIPSSCTVGTTTATWTISTWPTPRAKSGSITQTRACGRWTSCSRQSCTSCRRRAPRTPSFASEATRCCGTRPRPGAPATGAATRRASSSLRVTRLPGRSASLRSLTTCSTMSRPLLATFPAGLSWSPNLMTARAQFTSVAPGMPPPWTCTTLSEQTVRGWRVKICRGKVKGRG